MIREPSLGLGFAQFRGSEFGLGLAGPSTAGTAYAADSPVLGKAGLPLHSWPDGWLIDDRGLHRSSAPRRHPRPIDLIL